jgi:hypothetical protein
MEFSKPGRVRFLCIGAATLLSVGLLGASPVAAAAATLSGTIKIDATIKVDAAVPANTIITATGNFQENGSGTSHGATRTVTVKFTPGKTAHAIITVPYTCTVVGSAATFSVYLSVSTNVPSLPFAGSSRPIALPKNGATVTVNLPAAI